MPEVKTKTIREPWDAGGVDWWSQNNGPLPGNTGYSQSKWPTDAQEKRNAAMKALHLGDD